MHDHDKIIRALARTAVLAIRYARIWKAIISGTVPARVNVIGAWYGAAQHALAACLHAAEGKRISASVDPEVQAVKSAA